MDKVLAGLAVLVLLLVFTIMPQHRNCGIALAVVLGASAFLLNRCEGPLGCLKLMK